MRDLHLFPLETPASPLLWVTPPACTLTCAHRAVSGIQTPGRNFSPCPAALLGFTEQIQVPAFSAQRDGAPFLNLTCFCAPCILQGSPGITEKEGSLPHPSLWHTLGSIWSAKLFPPKTDIGSKSWSNLQSFGCPCFLEFMMTTLPLSEHLLSVLRDPQKGRSSPFPLAYLNPNPAIKTQAPCSQGLN